MARVAALGPLITNIDSTVVNVSLSALGPDLHASLMTLQWVITGYPLALALMLPLSGWLVDLRFEEPVLSWRASQSGDGVSVTTEKQTYQARSLVISVGPWFAELVPSASMPIIVSLNLLASLPLSIGESFRFSFGSLIKAPCSTDFRELGKLVIQK